MKANSAIYKSYPFGKNINQCANSVVAFVSRAKFSLKFWQRCLSVAFFIALTLIAFCGCAEKVAYKEVFVPQKCSVLQKPRPAKTGELLKDFDTILIYTELLEQDLNICRGLE